MHPSQPKAARRIPPSVPLTSFGIFIVEKEFKVGPITADFLMMKFWNLLDKTNIDRYNAMTNGSGGTDGVNTLG